MSRPAAARLALALRADDERIPLEALERRLAPGERRAARAHGGRRRRHFVLGRLAARAALRRLLGRTAAVEIRAGVGGAPEVRGLAGPPVGVGIAHSGGLVAACAWTAPPGAATRVGLDVERVRPSDVGHSGYAFSGRERRLLRAAGGDPTLAGLAGWVAKESAWKALRLPPEAGPPAVVLRALRLERGRALVRARGTGATFAVRLRSIVQPDGLYVLALARERPGPPGRERA